MGKTNNTRQAAWIAIGSLFSFGFTIVSSMILSRYFDKSDYGTYKQVLYVYHTLLTVFTLGLPKAYSYYLPRVGQNQAKSLINKLTSLFLLLGGVFSLLLFVFAPQIASILKNENLIEALRLFAIVPLLMLPTMGLEGILSTYRKALFFAVYTIATRLVMLLCVAIPVVFFKCGYMGAIGGFVLSSAFSCALALILKYYPVKQYAKERCDVRIIEIFKFSLPLLFASLWGMVIRSADQFFVSRYFGTVVFAEYSNGAMELPFVGMIVGACAAVLSPIFSRLSHEQVDFKKEVYPLWMSVFEKTVKLIYPLVIYCIFFADVVMIALYGKQYEISATYFRIKLLANFFTLISYASLIINTGNVKYYQNVHMYGAVILIVSEYFSIILFNSPYVVTIVSVVNQIGRILFMLYFVSTLFNTNILQLFPMKVIGKILIPSFVILFVIRYVLDNFTDLINSNSVLALIVSFSAYILLFLIFGIKTKLNYISIIKPFFRK